MNSYLDARDQREQVLTQVLSTGKPSVVFLSLNVPGVDKMPAGSSELFDWALRQLLTLCPDCVVEIASKDALGFFAILLSGREAVEIKQLAVRLEASSPAARLVDVDVYGSSGEQLGRRELKLPPRACLLCDQPAVDCMRAKRHDLNEIVVKAHELLTNFSA